MQYDVIVMGGGISGCMAAIAAARMGASVLLVERLPFLGGTLTACGVGPMMSFHAGEKQVVCGIPDELVQRLVKKGFSPGHIVDTIGYTATVTPFDNEGMKTELENMVIESGCKVLYHTLLAGVGHGQYGIDCLSLCGKTGPMKVAAKVYVDATGDGDLSAMAGVGFSIGRPQDDKPQAISMMLRVNNVNMAEVRAYIAGHSQEFPALEGKEDLPLKASRLGAGGFTEAVARAKADGAYPALGPEVLMFECNTPGEVIINTSRLYGYNTLDAWSLSEAEIAGRQQAAELYRFAKAYLPGFQKAQLMYTGPYLGIRSSRQIQGEYTVTDEDLQYCRVFEDAVAYSGYPADIHSPDGAFEKQQQRDHLNENRRSYGQVRQLPYRCLVNPVVDNLITVGRCASLSFKAQGAFRTAPIAGAIGQAGGTAAALAARHGCPARAVNAQALRRTLAQQGAYVE